VLEEWLRFERSFRPPGGDALLETDAGREPARVRASGAWS